MTHNAIQCPKCKDIIFSIAHHDFHHCSCGAVHVDGGFSYLRFGWATDIEPPEPITITIPTKTKEEYHSLWANSKLTDPPLGLIKGEKKWKKKTKRKQK